MVDRDTPPLGAPDSRDGSTHDSPLDDWLGDEAELEWFPGSDATGVGRTGTWRIDEYDDPQTEAERVIRRRRTIGLALVLGIVVVAAIALIVILSSGGSNGSPTTPVATTTPPPATTPTPSETTPPSGTTPAPGTTTTPATATTPATGTTTPSTGGTAAVVLPASGSLRTGDTGDGVKQVQTAVGKLGFDPGPVDGVYGSQTVRAVAAFQEANGLANDGIVGADTAAKMNAALASSSSG